MWRSLYRLDPETAHSLAMKALQTLHSASPAAVRALCGIKKQTLEKSISLKKVAGIDFINPLGLAAGFDKNGEYVDLFEDCGFGFVEVGTVTPRAQSGNEKPRLYRDIQERKLFNRMGFNNEGAQKVAARLAMKSSKIKMGVNIGKNKATPNEKAYDDYRDCARVLAPYADYLVLNVSSPNTPGLRDLQTVENLSKIVTEVVNELQKVTKTVPLFIKLAPELDETDFNRLFSPLEGLGVGGWVLTNTLGGVDPWGKNLSGGWSGSVLTELALDRLKVARAMTSKPIISVGGILSPEDAQVRLEAGADLIQIYSGWILNGPRFPAKILEKTAKN